MINFDDVTKGKKEHNSNWSQISDHPYRLLMIWSSGSIKTILHLI